MLTPRAVNPLSGNALRHGPSMARLVEWTSLNPTPRSAMRTRQLVAALLVSAVFTPTAAPAQRQAIVRKVFTSDSLAVSHAQTSPDGKWLVIAAWRGTSSSLWITLTAGGPVV